MRDEFVDVIWNTEEDGTIKAIGNVSVDVYQLDANHNRMGTRPTLYQAITGGASNPNPFVTNDGSVRFFTDPGLYEIVFTDLEVPPRIAQDSIWWSAVPGGEAGINAEQLPDRGEGLIQPGDIIFCGYEDPGPGYVYAADQYVTRAAPYDRVFARYGTKFNKAGDSDGSKFRLPDMRGRLPMGWGSPTGFTGGHADVDTIGKSDPFAVTIRRAKHKHGRGTLAASQPPHTHRQRDDQFFASFLNQMGGVSALHNGGTSFTANDLYGDIALATPPVSLSGEIGDGADMASQPSNVIPHLVCMFKIRL